MLRLRIGQRHDDTCWRLAALRAFFTPAWLIDTPEAFIFSAIARSARPLSRGLRIRALQRGPTQLGFQRNGRAENGHLRVIPALLKVAKLRSRRGRIRGGCPLGTPTAAYDGCASSCRGTS